MHAASDKPTRARIAGPLGGDCGPGPAEDARAALRSIFATCSSRRASSSPARVICSWARATDSIDFGVDGEFTGVSLFPSNVIRRWRSATIRSTCQRQSGDLREPHGRLPRFQALRPGARTTTIAPGFTRFTRSMTSSLVMRMQPDEMAWPIYSGWLVPWMRYRVSLLPW